MKIIASISVEKGSGYIFRLLESEPEEFLTDFNIIFEEFNYYDGEDDQIILVEEPKIEGAISKIDGDNYEAIFSGDFYFELPDEKLEKLLEVNNNNGIDYTIYLSSINEKIELFSDDDWEFIENVNIKLLNIDTSK